MWDNLTLIVNFLLSCLSSIGDLMLNTILVLGLGLSVIALVVKIFKRIL